MRFTAKFHGLTALLILGSANLWATDRDPFPDADYHKYQGSMIMINQVVRNGIALDDAVIAVYCDDELRGKDHVGNGAVYPDRAYTTVCGDYTGDDQYLYFKVYTDGVIYSYYPDPPLLYTFNGMVGSSADPYTIDLSQVCLDDTDVTPLISKYKGSQVNVSFRRRFTENVSSTVCMPFSISSQQASAYGTFYEFSGVTRDENEWTVTMTQATDDSPLVAGKPYLFKPSVTGTVLLTGTVDVPADATTDSFLPANVDAIGEWSFIGTYGSIEWTEGHRDLGSVYGFVAIEYTGGDFSAGSFVMAGAGASIAPFRAYLMRNQASHAPGRAPKKAGNDMPQSIRVRLVDRNGSTTGVGIMDPLTGNVVFDSDVWYSLDGSRLKVAPTTPGIYIKGNRKVRIQ